MRFPFQLVERPLRSDAPAALCSLGKLQLALANRLAGLRLSRRPETAAVSALRAHLWLCRPPAGRHNRSRPRASRRAPGSAKPS